MEQFVVRIVSGTRVGFWNSTPSQGPVNEKHKNAFRPVGFYVGPDLGDQLIGTRLMQRLMEGDLYFRVGVLFRPDLGKYQRVETILMLENWIPEMFDYDSWDKLNLSSQTS